MDKHDIAKSYGLKAVSILDEFYEKEDPDSFFIQILATAHHNLASEHEFMREYSDALIHY